MIRRTGPCAGTCSVVACVAVKPRTGVRLGEPEGGGDGIPRLCVRTSRVRGARLPRRSRAPGPRRRAARPGARCRPGPPSARAVGRGVGDVLGNKDGPVPQVGDVLLPVVAWALGVVPLLPFDTICVQSMGCRVVPAARACSAQRGRVRGGQGVAVVRPTSRSSHACTCPFPGRRSAVSVPCRRPAPRTRVPRCAVPNSTVLQSNSVSCMTTHPSLLADHARGHGARDCQCLVSAFPSPVHQGKPITPTGDDGLIASDRQLLGLSGRARLFRVTARLGP